jgi:hypothetical protein
MKKKDNKTEQPVSKCKLRVEWSPEIKKEVAAFHQLDAEKDACKKAKAKASCKDQEKPICPIGKGEPVPERSVAMEMLVNKYNELVENHFDSNTIPLEDVASLLWSLKSSDFAGRTNDELDFYSLVLSTIVKSFSIDEQKAAFAAPMCRINSFLAGSYQSNFAQQEAKEHISNEDAIAINVMKTFTELYKKKSELDGLVTAAYDALNNVVVCNKQLASLFKQLEIYLH